MATKKKKAGAAAAGTGAGGPGTGAAAAAGGVAKPAKPCGTCDPTLPYSIQFRVKDANGKLCDRMYYTVKYKNSGEVYTGSTQGDAVATEQTIGKLGLTLRYYTSDASEEVFLYLGHRTTADGYPESRTGAENITDEAPLHQDTVAPAAELKISDAETDRLWKPWGASANYKSVIEGAESREPSQYPSVEGGNDTIGIGHKITDAEIASQRFTKGYWAQPLSDAKMDELLNEDIAKNGGNKIDSLVFVPLHNYEVDAILDLGFNGGPGALSANASSLYTHDGAANAKGTNRQNLSELLNRGRYSLVPGYFQTHYNTAGGKWVAGVQNRRDMDARMFSGDTVNGYTLLQNHTTKRPAHVDP
jgi:GH24 family phage-related lysozyme (muramidase)